MWNCDEVWTRDEFTLILNSLADGCLIELWCWGCLVMKFLRLSLLNKNFLWFLSFTLQGFSVYFLMRGNGPTWFSYEVYFVMFTICAVYRLVKQKMKTCTIWINLSDCSFCFQFCVNWWYTDGWLSFWMLNCS